MASLRNVLITDRTQRDVLARNEKGTYSDTDLNRVLRATAYLARRLAELGSSVPFDYYAAYLMDVEARPRSGGAVRGDVKYEGEEAAVEAIPTADFQFLWWEEAGTVVSKSPAYSFPAERDRDLTAVFLAPGEADNGIIGIGRIGQARIWPEGG